MDRPKSDPQIEEGPSTLSGTRPDWGYNRILMGIQWDTVILAGFVCSELVDSQFMNRGGSNLKRSLSLFSSFFQVLQWHLRCFGHILEAWRNFHGVLFHHDVGSKCILLCSGTSAICAWKWPRRRQEFSRESFLAFSAAQVIQEAWKWNGITKPLNF